MSLRYVIDGYNITNHPLFAKLANRRLKDPRAALLELIATRRLSGSPKNKIIVVFDGYQNYENSRIATEEHPAIKVIFAAEESADARIIKIAQESDPPNTVVVSDDKQIRIFVRSLGCRTLSVEEFIDYRKNLKGKDAPPEPELTYTQKEKINRELKKIWLQ
jgi:predicted RNA-binding protein with PIN domain